MADLIPFPARPLRVVALAEDSATCTKVSDKPAFTVSECLTDLRKFILAMGPEADSLQMKQDFHVRQGKIFETWVDESVIELGHDVVIEMLESMLLHLKKERR